MSTVRDLLNSKKSKEVYSIAPDATVYKALELMCAREVGALMVMKKKEVVGIISERDYARKISLRGKSAKTTKVSQVMTTKLVQVGPHNSVDECMVLMTGKHVRHLPVFEHGKFIAIVSIGDVVKFIISKQEMLIEQLSNYIAGGY